ncbi:unnamed protein product [Ascophyllum nodosum]
MGIYWVRENIQKYSRPAPQISASLKCPFSSVVVI